MQTFVNHGCNGSFNIAGSPSKVEQTITEQNANESDQYSFRNDDIDWENYNPSRLRRLHHYNAIFEVALKDISAGEELFTDYLDFVEGEDWWEEVQELKRICNGKDVGYITKREKTDSMKSNQ